MHYVRSKKITSNQVIMYKAKSSLIPQVTLIHWVAAISSQTHCLRFLHCTRIWSPHHHPNPLNQYLLSMWYNKFPNLQYSQFCLLGHLPSSHQMIWCDKNDKHQLKKMNKWKSYFRWKKYPVYMRKFQKLIFSKRNTERWWTRNQAKYTKSSKIQISIDNDLWNLHKSHENYHKMLTDSHNSFQTCRIQPHFSTCSYSQIHIKVKIMRTIINYKNTRS